MDRIKLKISKNSEQLREECEAVQQLLNTVLQKDRNAIQDISNLSDTDLRSNKKHLLGILEFQAAAMQKLLELGVELDEFLKHPTAILGSNVDGVVLKSEISLTSLVFPSDTSIQNRSLVTAEDTVKSEVATPHLERVNFNVSESGTKVNVKTVSGDSDEEINKNKCIAFRKSKKVDKDNKDVTEIATTSSATDCGKLTSSDETTDVKDILPDSPQLTKASDISLSQLKDPPKAVINLDEAKIEANDSSSDASSISNKSNKKSSADISSSEEVSVKKEGKSIQEKLKSKKLMTRRDRFLQNIQRPEIPDLSFKPTNKVFDSTEGYLTCPESSSSTSAVKVNDRKRKKKRVSERDDLASSNGVIGYGEPPEPYVGLRCLISHLVSPSEFYINYIDENIAIIDTMSYQLAEIFKDTSSPYADKKTAMEALGNQCVCYIDSYNSWYRVNVTNWRLNARHQEKEVTVYLVDYGHTRNVSYENLRELTEEFCIVQQYAIKCHLAWLYPPGSTENNLLDIWPPQSLEYFHDLFSKDNDRVYNIVYVEKCGNSWGVDIMFTDSEDEDLTFGQLMLDNKMAVEVFQNPRSMISNSFIVDQIKTAQGVAGITPDMDLEEKLDKFNENTRDCEYGSIDQAMLRYKATDEARTCKHTRADGTCFKGKRCKLDHGRLRRDGITTDKQCVYVSAFKELEMPEAGTTVKLRVVNVVSINTFYACLINAQSEGLKNLIRIMNTHDTINKYKLLAIPPAQGELVIAKSWNKHWYRARVQDIYHYPQHGEETVQVFLVDLGDIVDVRLSDLRTITEEFLYLPFQAILCRLYNVKPIPDQNQEKAKYYAESSFLCQIFDAEVMHVSCSTLEVLLKKEDNCEDVGEQIIEDGFGELRTDHQFPIMTESLLVD